MKADLVLLLLAVSIGVHSLRHWSENKRRAVYVTYSCGGRVLVRYQPTNQYSLLIRSSNGPAVDVGHGVFSAGLYPSVLVTNRVRLW